MILIQNGWHPAVHFFFPSFLVSVSHMMRNWIYADIYGSGSFVGV